jgi:UDP-MurNAc hydroxylase
MQVRLVSHASVVISTADVRIWTDPWLVGKVFNDSWSLLVPPAWDEAMLDEIDHLWVSHEHPDHFNLPTLKALPAAFKRRVTVLFQALNTDKMFDAFRRLGFVKLRALPHRELVALTPNTSVYCYQVGQMDSCLAVRGDGQLLVDINDAEADAGDCRTMRADLGPARVVLNQFSLAGYSCEADRDARLPGKARRILDNMIANHRDLGADATIPFASFVYFSSVDNAYMNAYANSPRAAHAAFAAAGLELAVLDHGDTYTVGAPWDSGPALRRYDAAWAALPGLPLDPVAPVALAEICAAAERLGARLAERYPRWFLRAWLRPVTVEVVDLGATIELDLAHARTRSAPGAAPDLSLHGQPLLFLLQHPYGSQTLGVSARLTLRANAGNWRRHRVLLAMYNAEVYLRPRLLLTRRNLGLLRVRLRGGLRQLAAQLARMR